MQSKFIINNNTSNPGSRKKGVYLSSIAIFLFTLFIFSQSFFSIILQSYILQIGILLFILSLLFFRPNSYHTIQFNYTIIDLLWANSIIIIIVYIIFSDLVKYSEHLFTYIIGILFLLLTKVDINKFEASFKLIKLASFIFAVSTIFHYIFTDIFHAIVFPFIPLTVKIRMLELVNIGYYPGLGLAQPAIASGYMVLGIGIILSNFRFENKGSKRVDTFLLLLLIISILMVGKRSILIWVILAAIITYYNAANIKEKIGRIIKLSIYFIISLIIFFVTISYFKSVPFLNRIMETISGLIAGEDVTSGRIVLYNAAWELFKEKPLFGIGWGQFIEVTSGQLLSRDLIVHNVYLQLLAETGIVGFLAVFIPFIYVYYKTYKMLKKLFSGDFDNYHYLWKIGFTFSFFIQTFFLLYCLTENPFYNMVYMFIYFLSITIVNSFMVYNKVLYKYQ